VNTAPTVIFAFRRPRHLEAVLDGLRANPEAPDTPLVIYCDGARSVSDTSEVRAVREVAQKASGFASVRIIERSCNFGLSRSITEGVRVVCEEFGSAVVLEDDVVPTPYFLSYVNSALARYADDRRVLSIGCYSFDAGIDLPETFFLQVPDCWGWAVWKRSWDRFDPNAGKLLGELQRRNLARRFDFDRAYPYTRMLADRVKGLNDSWAICWYATALLTDSLVLYPRRAVTANIGFDGTGTHIKSSVGQPASLAADRPIRVQKIPLEESPLGRRVWRAALKACRASLLQRAAFALRSRPGRLWRSFLQLLTRRGR
jgi:hypothetical protein